MAFDRAIALAHTPAEAAHIRQHLDQPAARNRAAVGLIYFARAMSATCRACSSLGRHQPAEARDDASRHQPRRHRRGDTPAVKGGVIAYVTVDGAMKAADFYRQAFGAELVTAHPVDEQGRTMHVHLHINGSSVMLSDPYPEHGHPWRAPQGFNLTLYVDDIDAWWARAVAAGVEMVLPVSEMFWGDRYGQVRDPFGVLWAMNQPRR